MSCAAHDTGLPVRDRAGQSRLLVFLVFLAHLLPTCLLFLVLDLLYHSLVNRELDGIGCWTGAQVVHTRLQALLKMFGVLKKNYVSFLRVPF